MPSPLLPPHSPRDSNSNSQGPRDHTSHYRKRVPNINTGGFAGSESMTRDTAYSPTKILPSTSTISLLSLSFSNANLEDDGTTIGSVLEEPQQPPQSPKQLLWRKAGHLTPSTSFTNAGQYLNSAHHRRVSHYISGISSSPTSVSRRGSAVSLPQFAGTPSTPGAQTIPGSSKSRRASYTLQSPGQSSSSPMYSHMMIPPDSPPLGPVSLCNSPSKMFLAQTPPVGQYSRWASTAVSTAPPSNVIDIIQEHAADEEEDSDKQQQQQHSSSVDTTAAALAAALEIEINNHKVSPIAIPMRYGGPGSPALGPVMSPLEAAPMTPMALDLHSQQNSLQNQAYLTRLHQLQQRQMSLVRGSGEPGGVMEALNGE